MVLEMWVTKVAGFQLPFTFMMLDHGMDITGYELSVDA